jgi:hypothetical protein
MHLPFRYFNHDNVGIRAIKMSNILVILFPKLVMPLVEVNIKHYKAASCQSSHQIPEEALTLIRVNYTNFVSCVVYWALALNDSKKAVNLSCLR